MARSSGRQAGQGPGLFVVPPMVPELGRVVEQSSSLFGNPPHPPEDLRFNAADSLFYDPAVLAQYGIDVPTLEEFVANRPAMEFSPDIWPQTPTQKRSFNNNYNHVDYTRLFEEEEKEEEEEGKEGNKPCKPPVSWSTFEGLPNTSQRYLLDTPQSRAQTIGSVLQLRVGQSDPSSLCAKALPPEYVLRCVAGAVCGRQSELFRYDTTRQVFSETLTQQYTVPGVSAAAVAHLVKEALDAGARFLRLRYSCHVIFQCAGNKNNDTSPRAGPVLVALASSIAGVLSALEAHILSGTPTDALLAADGLVRGPVAVINMTAQLLGCADLSRALILARLPAPWKLLNALYAKCVHLEGTAVSDTVGGLLLPSLFTRMLVRTVEQWLTSLEPYIGLDPNHSLLLGVNDPDTFLELEEDQEMQTSAYYDKTISAFNPVGTPEALRIRLYGVNETKVPRFVSQELAQMCADCANCLVLLERHAADDPQTQAALLRLHTVVPIRLHWMRSVSEVAVQSRAIEDYVSRVTAAIREGVEQQDTSMHEYVAETQENSVTDLLKAMDAPPAPARPADETFYATVFGSSSQPVSAAAGTAVAAAAAAELEMQLHVVTMRSVGPVLRAQAALLHEFTWQAVFSGETDLSAHMKVVREVVLLGSGLLLNDLREQVFGTDPGALGLCSKTLEYWPPGPARIHSALSEIVSSAVKRILPSDQFINIGLRGDLVTGKVARASAQYDLKATQFLRMVYTPPPVLQGVIPTRALAIYDTAFGWLLQLVHAQQVAQRAVLETPSVQVFEAGVLANVLVVHFAQNAVEAVWAPWMRWLCGKNRHALSSVRAQHLVMAQTLEQLLFLDNGQSQGCEIHKHVRAAVHHLVQSILDCCSGKSTQLRKARNQVQAMLDRLEYQLEPGLARDLANQLKYNLEM
ncbi:uncharacterized protein SAPINGB_P000297 [Magnusiomyces paraingens]|uniref:Gamma tubulin complex component C-terminal domain-containing protein n=1 Tax=Magnusiomyces paraingens TaxID=2606893 RepID=A0A5E8B5B9_9ASCO|nr:uncharacterized protein SAPINGB_P000297 [Saprochaete ingens]VVT44090.1 unnamed protein product [Saprochaete ingens]